MVQLVPCNDVNAVDRLGGQISIQMAAVLKLVACSHQKDRKKPLFIRFKQVLRYDEIKLQPYIVLLTLTHAHFHSLNTH